ncbi:hypothetical protein [Peterkaempfera griseoplana]|nr:hypothetical protein [Peterkaempfera griseoplana]
MDARGKATVTAAAGRHTVNAFRLHHFAGLGCHPGAASRPRRR